MNSFADVIDKWPSGAEMARDIGIKPTHLQTMKARGSIPSKFWPDIVAAAAQRGLPGITLELLGRLSRGDRDTGARSDLAIRIATARDRAGWSQTKLGDEVAVSRGAVCQWESGRTEPSAANLREISMKTGVDYNWLATGRGRPGNDADVKGEQVPSNRIAEHRDAKGMTQQQLADALNVHWQTISKLERGKMQLTADWAVKIGKALDADYRKLFAAPMQRSSATPEPNSLTPAHLRGWIRQICTRVDIYPTELAEEAGLARSTINRFLRSGNEETLNARTIEALKAAAARLEERYGVVEYDSGPSATGVWSRLFMTSATLPLREGVVKIDIPGSMSAQSLAAVRAWFDLLLSLREEAKPASSKGR